MDIFPVILWLLVGNKRDRCRPKLTWEQVVWTDMAACGIGFILTENGRAWKAVLRHNRTLSLAGLELEFRSVYFEIQIGITACIVMVLYGKSAVCNAMFYGDVIGKCGKDGCFSENAIASLIL